MPADRMTENHDAQAWRRAREHDLMRELTEIAPGRIGPADACSVIEPVSGDRDEAKPAHE